VHEQAAIAICSRCGTHLCKGCGPLGDPPLCEACDARLSQEPRPRTKTRVVALVVLAFFLGVPTLIAVLMRVLFGGR
jgi:hypothetical protein